MNEDKIDAERFITRDELAALLTVSTQQVINLEKKGVLEGYRVGGNVRYQFSEVKEQLRAADSRQRLKK
jgi:excisionase family DNA binding protein